MQKKLIYYLNAKVELALILYYKIRNQSFSHSTFAKAYLLTLATLVVLPKK
ncbi:hypothetical protein IWQ47_002578 [Aquimarina sp. EL_43]|nr:hypothetical protein [Aquimarina sp. EL_35]MBG6151567.1 hypothetical protein [Aquimarina sp. EL_32]MBG6169498.1 hypothetical protein [Aquimarina sp. EL_43]